MKVTGRNQNPMFKAYWRRVITSRYSRALFKGAADMQQQLTACVQTLDPSRELALVFKVLHAST